MTDRLAKEKLDDAMFLLGAGASADGGLPIGTVLTEAIAADLRARDHASPEVKQLVIDALDYIMRVLPGAPDFESVGAVARDLAERDESSLAPFVEEWDAGLKSIPPDAFFLLYDAMCSSIRRKLLIEDPARFDYLMPLVELGTNERGVTIATLNYDLSVEVQARSRAISVDAGFDELNADRVKTWNRSGIRLVKPHGSIGWSYPIQTVYTGEVPRTTIAISKDPSTDDDPPAIIFGRGNKMRPAGLFLHLYINFVDLLNQSKTLVTTGYSFRDDHINEAIRRWLARVPNSKLYIVDPNVPDLIQPAIAWGNSDTSLRLAGVFESLLNSAPNNYVLPPGRVLAVKSGAADGLAQLLR